MLLKRLPSLFIVLFFVILPLALPAQTKTPQSIAITNVTVIDVKSGEAKADMTVLITGNRITSVDKSSKTKIPKTAQIINAKGKFLIPGLWDMHVHLFNNISGNGTNNKEEYFPLYIANGVTGIRDMWTDPEDLKLARQWNKETATGKLIGPRIAAGSSIVDGMPTFLPNLFGVTNAEEARQAVRKLKDAGAGFIKVYFNLSPEAYYAIAEESKKLKIDFAGHVPLSMTAGDVSDAGQKSIEHMTGIASACSSQEDELRKKQWTPAVEHEMRASYDHAKCMNLFKRFVKNGTWQTPTVILHRGMMLGDQTAITKDERLRYVIPSEVKSWIDPWAARKNIPAVDIRNQRFNQLLNVFYKMHKEGVPILAGTDVGNPFIIAGFSLHDELKLFVQAGLTPLEALQAATLNPAKYLNMTDSVGSIEKAKLADLVLLDANPLDNINNTQKIFAVVTNGKYLPKETLNKMLKDVEERVKNR